MSDTALDRVTSLARPAVRDLPAYHAGPPSQSIRERYGVLHVARLASNENPHGPAPQVRSALTAAFAELGCYPDAGCTALREAMARTLACEPQQLVIGNGSESLLGVLCEAFLEPGDRVLTQSPCFGLHDIFPRMMGAQVEMVPVTGALSCDVDAWCAALRGPRPPKLVFLPNPSNPVGCMFDRAGFERVVQAMPTTTLLVVDEAYHEYAALSPAFPDTLAVLHRAAMPWMVLRTFSKAWGLAALRVGYGIGSEPTVVRMLDKVRTPFNVNHLAQTAALAAWQHPAHMRASVQATVARREALAAQIRALGLRHAPSAANFLFVDCGRDNRAVSEALLRRGVLVKPWKDPGYEHFIRVSVGSDEDNALFVQALSALA